jgi:pimeloyl-ACP methyl ester carboxylesterase
LRPPPLSRLAFEYMLPPIELAALVAGSPLLSMGRRGDGHPVLLLPGFIASDAAMRPLRAILAAKGFAATGWGLGTNLGPHPHIVDGMTRRLEELHEASGRKVSLVGWSLGGMYARELARRHPEWVRAVVTLASPFRMREFDRNRATWWYELLGPDEAELVDLSLAEQDRNPVPVPCTSIYSRLDGVVRWHACIDEDGPGRENIEVRGSHSGLAWNLAAVYAACDRLAQPEGAWQPFRPPAALRRLYPRPDWWEARTA